MGVWRCERLSVSVLLCGVVCSVGVLLEAFAGPTQGGEVGRRVAAEELVGSGGGREEGCAEHGSQRERAGCKLGGPERQWAEL